jgi:hypothetical protein
MKKFSRFYFNSFEFNTLNLQAKFHYNFDNEVFFTEILDFKDESFLLR